MDLSLSAPRPATLDVSLMSCWVLVVAGRQVLFVDSTPLYPLGLALLFSLPYYCSSCQPERQS